MASSLISVTALTRQVLFLSSCTPGNFLVESPIILSLLTSSASLCPSINHTSTSHPPALWATHVWKLQLSNHATWVRGTVWWSTHFLVLLQLVYSLEDYGLLHVWLLSKHLKQIMMQWITLSNTAVLNFSESDTLFVELGCCNFQFNYCVRLPVDQLPLLGRWWMRIAMQKHDLYSL